MNPEDKIQRKNISLLGIIVAIVYFIVKVSFNFIFTNALSYFQIISIIVLFVSFILMYIDQKRFAVFGFMISSLLFLFFHGSELLYNLQYLAKFYAENSYYPDHIASILQIIYRPLFLSLSHLILVLHSIKVINGGVVRTKVLYPIILVILVVCNLEYLNYYLNSSPIEIASVFIFSNLVRVFPFLLMMIVFPPAKTNQAIDSISQVQTSDVNVEDAEENDSSSYSTPTQQINNLENNIKNSISDNSTADVRAKTLSVAEKIIWTIVLWIVWPITIELILGNGLIGNIVQAIFQIGGTIYVWTRPRTIKN